MQEPCTVFALSIVSFIREVRMERPSVGFENSGIVPELIPATNIPWSKSISTKEFVRSLLNYYKFKYIKCSFLNTVYTASGDTCARAFVSQSGKLRRLFQGHAGAIINLKIVGKKLFTASSDKTLRVWSLEDIE